MTEQRDIVIAGGGMVGISLALHLGQLLPENIRILLVEGYPFPEPNGAKAPDYHPSFDARSTALSYSTQLIYEQLGLWQDLVQWLCPIETIHVSSRGHFGSALLNAQDYGWPALGYVVENAWLGQALASALHAQGRIEVMSPARVERVEPAGSGVRLTLAGGSDQQGDSNQQIEAALLVVADGADSGLRAQLGVLASEKPYGQRALIANIATAQPHGGCAYERFTDEGPLALLPLGAAPGAENRSALVWTLPPARAEQLLACDEAEFLADLQARFGYRLGRLRQVSERHCYPLTLVEAAEQVRQGIVVMGNAAHALHPVAGQGFNLALRDVAELARCVAASVAAGRSPGDLASLQDYERAQRADQERTIGFSDKGPALFMQSDPVLGLGRDMALMGLDLLPGLKAQFVRYAAGVADMELSGHG